MKQTIVSIGMGILVLIIFIAIGIPFDFESPAVDSILRCWSFLIVFSLLFILFKTAKNVKRKVLRISVQSLLGLLTFYFILGAIWNDCIRTTNDRNWYTLEIGTNASGTKILKQLRETSGSIYDYRERWVLYEFDNNNRLSINAKASWFDGPWTWVDVRKNKLSPK